MKTDYDICDGLYQHRVSRRLTQKQLAQALHYSQSTYASYERGARRLSVEEAARLADFYGITLDELIGRKI